MGFLDKLLGREEDQPTEQNRSSYEANRPYGNSQTDAMGRTRTLNSVGEAGAAYGESGNNGDASSEVSLTDQQALARYRYMLQTAPPESIEQAHAEAFSRLTPEQRQLALQQLAENVPENERPGSDDPQSLARAATRAEMRQPGALERVFGGAGGPGGGMGSALGGGGTGIGGMIAGSLLGSVAGTFIGSAIAHQFFSQPAVAADYNSSAEAQNAGDTAEASGGDGADAEPANVDSQGNADPYGDPAATDSAGNSDLYGDPADADGDANSWGGLDSGGFDGGFDGGDF